MFDVSDFRIIDFYFYLVTVSFISFKRFLLLFSNLTRLFYHLRFALSRDRKSRETLTSAADPDGTNNLSGWRVRSLIMKSHNFEPAE